MNDPKKILIFSREEEEVNETIRSTFHRVSYNPIFVRTIGDMVNRIRYDGIDMLLFIDPQMNDFLLVVNKVEMPKDMQVVISTNKYINDMEITSNCAVHVIKYPLDMKDFKVVHEKMALKLAPSKNILIVEDEEINQEIIKSMLTHFNCVSSLAEDGVTALKMVQEEKPDLILLDLKLPYITGDQVLYWIRGRYSKEELPVLVISSQEDKKEILSVAKLGVAGYLVKPFDKEQFIEKVAEIVAT